MGFFIGSVYYLFGVLVRRVEFGCYYCLSNDRRFYKFFMLDKEREGIRKKNYFRIIDKYLLSIF